MYAYRGLSTLPDNPGDSRFGTIPAPTLFAGFSLTLPYGERERKRDPGLVWSHGSRTKLKVKFIFAEPSK